MTKRDGKAWNGIAASAGFFCLSLLLFHPALSGEVLSVRDLTRLTYPNRWLASRIWSAGELPLWNSAAALGMPLAGDPITGAFDPFTLFFFLPGPVETIGTLVIGLRFVLGGLFMFRFLRLTDRTGAAAFLGGAAYMFSGFSVGSWTLFQWVAALPYLPLALAAPYSGGRPVGRGLSAGAIFTLMLFSGSIEPLLMTMVLWSLELACGDRSDPEERLRQWCIGLLSFAGFALMQILPTAELYFLSHRAGGMGTEQALAYSVSLLQSIGHVLPLSFIPEDGGPVRGAIFSFAQPLFFSTYVGVTLLPLAILGTAWGRFRFAVVAVTAWILASGRYIPGLEDLVAQFRILTILGFPVKILYFVPPCIAILTAAGYDRLSVATETRRALSVVLAFVTICVVVAAGIAWPDSQLPYANLMIANLTSRLVSSSTHVAFSLLAIAFILVGRDHLGRALPFLLVGLIATDLSLAGNRTLHFEPGARIEQPPLRSAMAGPWPRILTTSTNDFRWGGTGSAHVQALLDVNSGIPWMVRHGSQYASFRLSRHEAWWNECTAAEPEESTRKFGSAGIRYFTCDNEAESSAIEAGWTPVTRWRDLALLENPHLLPETRFYPDTSSSLPSDTMLRTPGLPVTAELFLDGTLDARFTATAPGWLYRAESYYEGWKAWSSDEPLRVAGSPGTIGQFVRIEKTGDARIRMRYRPPLFFIGLTASFCSSLLALFALMRKRGERVSPVPL